MIRCTYCKSTRELTVEGHANYAPPGVDIVCAGVTALEMALNAWMEQREDCIVRLEPSASYFRGTESTDDVMECIWRGLVQISKWYENFCKCTEKS